MPWDIPGADGGSEYQMTHQTQTDSLDARDIVMHDEELESTYPLNQREKEELRKNPALRQYLQSSESSETLNLNEINRRAMRSFHTYCSPEHLRSRILTWLKTENLDVPASFEENEGSLSEHIRLLNVHSFELVYFARSAPKYAIASHVWAAEECTYHEFREKRDTKSAGFQKIQGFAEYIKEHLSSIDWLWIDTCCIDKAKLSEVSWSIHSMFSWYRNAEVCIAYLADVQEDSGNDLTHSVWFKRGWTLQELIAPQAVVFLTSTWKTIGRKTELAPRAPGNDLGVDLNNEIAAITGIPSSVLSGWRPNMKFDVEKVFSWMSGRETTIPEDSSYAIAGMIGVALPIMYGEGGANARQRLLVEVRLREEKTSKAYGDALKLLSPSDQWTNHASARRFHEPGTCSWIFETPRYQAWKSGAVRHLWLYGIAGCGKTVLCSEIILDIQAYVAKSMGQGQVIFYFESTNTRKRSVEDLIRSMIHQLVERHRGLALLFVGDQTLIEADFGYKMLMEKLTMIAATYDEIFLHLDAVEDCLDSDHKLCDLLESLPNIRLITTSRDQPQIRAMLGSLGVVRMLLEASKIDADIKLYISRQLSNDRRLARLDAPTRNLIESTLTERASGM
jgi:hypothetical protein